MPTLIRILRYVTVHRTALTLGYISLFVALGFQLALPLVLASAIDNGIRDGDTTWLRQMALLYLGLSILQGLFTFARVYLLQRISEQAGYKIRDDLYRHLQRMPFSFYDRISSGQLMSRATDDINNVRGMLMFGLRTVPLLIGTLIFVAIILFWKDWKLALLSMVIFPPLILFTYRFGITVRPLFAGIQQQFGAMTAQLQENVAGTRVVRAFAQEQQEIGRFEGELNQLFQRNLRASRQWSFSFALIVMLSGVGTVVVIWVGGLQVINGAITVGVLVAFSRYLVIASEPIRWLGFLVNRIARAIASGQRIFEVLDEPSAIADRPDAVTLDKATVTGNVRFEGVTFTYPQGTEPALRDITFTARPGQTVALVGPTGSGKSTIAQLLPRFYDVDSGSVSIDGHDVRGVTLDSLRAEVSTVSQETFIFGLPIDQNIAFGRPDASREEIVDAAMAAGAHKFISHFPDGYDTVTGERGVSLSGGQRQRIAIARALLTNPHVLILDDATSSVDSQTEATIQTALRRLRSGRASIVIAQRLDSVRDADEILVLEGGEITQRGTHNQLLAQDGFYRRLYDLQSQQRSLDGTTASGLTNDRELLVRAGQPAAAPVRS